MKKRHIYLLLISSLALACGIFFYTLDTKQPVRSVAKVVPPKVIIKELSKKSVAKEENFKRDKNPQVSGAKHTSANFIQAPIQEAVIPFKSETVSSSSGKNILCSSNTQIIIPPNAFVDEQGRIVEGNVSVNYREFRDPTDIFLSGIPMTYENAQLESAGMIELTASANNKPVYVNPNNKIKIEMASSNQDADFNLYYLDTKEKRWKLKEENLKPETVVETSSQEILLLDNVYDENSLDDASSIYKTKIVSRKNEKISINGKKVKLVEPKLISGNYYDLPLNLEGFPELSLYANLKWQTIDSKKKRAVAGVLPEQIQLTGKPVVRLLNRIGESDSFTIRIAGSSNSVDIIFLPVFEVYDYWLAKTTYNKLLLSESDQTTARILQELKKEKSEVLVRRSFQIDGFGIYNCDRIYLIPSAKSITAKLVEAKTKKSIAGNFYLINKKVNSVFTYYTERPNNLTYSPLSENIVYTVLEDGKIAYCKFTDIMDASLGKEHTLELTIVDEEINSPEEAKKIFNSL